MPASNINRAFGAALLGLWLLFSQTGHTAASQPPPNAPVIRFESESLNLGKVLEGAVLTTRIKVRNTGGAPLHIRKVETGCCGITVLDFPPEVPPGGKDEIQIRINTTGVNGERTFKTAVHSNDPALPVALVKVMAQITPLLSITPDRIFLTGLAGRPLEQQLELIWRGETRLKVHADLNDVAQNIRVAISPLTPGRRFLLKAENLLHTPGSYRGRLLLRTNFPGKERIVVPVFGRITPAVAAYPARLVLTHIRCPQCPKQKYSGEVTIRSHDEVPFQVQNAAGEGLTCYVEPLIPGRAYRLQVRYTAESEQPLATHLQIRTDRKDFEVLTIPVSTP
ncbi:DUF1573 domain-containing protein [Desulfobacca acetoxidans]